MNFITKHITIEKTAWDKIKQISKEPQNRRDVGKQAGLLLEKVVDNYRPMKEIWRDLLFELDTVIEDSSVLDGDRLTELYKKRELLEKAFNEVGGE